MNPRALARGLIEPLLSLLPRQTRLGDRLILSYHNVIDTATAQFGERALHLPQRDFERQLRLIRNEADIVPLTELLTHAAPGERRVAITFDDAYASALRLGVAACESERAPCTVFVAPALLGCIPAWDRLAEQQLWTDHDRENFLWHMRGYGHHQAHGSDDAPLPDALRIATESELSGTIGRAGVTLGNHTMRHPNLAALSTEEATDEIQKASRWLTAFAPASHVPVVAYPYGLAPANAQAVLARVGLEFGLLVTGGWLRGDATPTAAIPRWNVPSGISAAGFTLRLRGWLLSRSAPPPLASRSLDR